MGVVVVVVVVGGEPMNFSGPAEPNAEPHCARQHACSRRACHLIRLAEGLGI